MKFIKTMALLSLAACIAVPAIAEKGEGGRHKGPGKHGKHRGPGGPGGFIKMMDANGDGTVTRAEFDAAQAKRVAKMQERLGDKFDLDAAADRANALFAKLDADGNNSISKDEAAKAKFGPPGRRPGPPHGKGGHGFGKGGPGKGGPGKGGPGKRERPAAE